MNINAKQEKRTNYLNTKVGKRKAKLSKIIWVLWCILLLPITIAVILVGSIAVFVKVIKFGKFFKELHKTRIIDRLRYECDYDTFCKIKDAIIFAYARRLYDFVKKLAWILDWPVKLICKERYKVAYTLVFCYTVYIMLAIFDK